MMGGAFSLVCFALPCNSGTGGTLLRGWVWVHSGRDMPCFAIAITSLIACHRMDAFIRERRRNMQMTKEAFKDA